MGKKKEEGTFVKTEAKPEYEYTIIDNIGFFFGRLKYAIKDKLDNFKYRCQRFKRGYADIDVWNMFSWFLNITPEMLERLKETSYGYPPDLTPEEWNQILDEMISCFKDANEETCSMKNPIGVWDVNDSNRAEWSRYEKKIAKFRDSKKKQGLKLFEKWFWDLWD